MAYAWLVRTTLRLTQMSYQGNIIGHRYTKIEMTIDRDKQPLQMGFHSTTAGGGFHSTGDRQYPFLILWGLASMEHRVSKLAVGCTSPLSVTSRGESGMFDIFTASSVLFTE